LVTRGGLPKILWSIQIFSAAADYFATRQTPAAMGSEGQRVGTARATASCFRTGWRNIFDNICCYDSFRWGRNILAEKLHLRVVGVILLQKWKVRTP